MRFVFAEATSAASCTLFHRALSPRKEDDPETAARPNARPAGSERAMPAMHSRTSTESVRRLEGGCSELEKQLRVRKDMPQPWINFVRYHSTPSAAPFHTSDRTLAPSDLTGPACHSRPLSVRCGYTVAHCSSLKCPSWLSAREK